MKNYRYLLAASLAVSACGTRDYPPVPQQDSIPTEERISTPPARSSSTPTIIPSRAKPGYLWSAMDWVKVPNESVKDMRCALGDGPKVDDFEAFGTALLGGALLGLVIRSSDSWFFGKPIEPAPGHWFWSRLEQGFKIGAQGAVRGALFAGACEVALAGSTLVPFRGLLGHNFSAVSAAATLAGMAALAGNPYVRHLFREDPSGRLKTAEEATESERAAEAEAAAEAQAKEEEAMVTGEPQPPPPRIRKRDRLWSATAELREGFHYRVAPGIMIVGIGTGIGLITYNWLQHEEAYIDWACTPEGVPIPQNPR